MRIIVKFLLVLCLVFYLFFSSRSSTNAVDLTADGNSDCKVDGLDYVLWLNNYGIETNSGKSGGNYSYQQGDKNVDGIDYVIWLNQYGQLCSPTSTPTLTLTPTVTSTPPSSNTFHLKSLMLAITSPHKKKPD